MDETQIYRELTAVFRDVFDDDTLVWESTTAARDVDGWDSFAHMNLIVAAESRFGIRFKTAELESMQNVGHFVDLIGEKLAQKST
jgi:acyl carrier protein